MKRWLKRGARPRGNGIYVTNFESANNKANIANKYMQQMAEEIGKIWQ